MRRYRVNFYGYLSINQLANESIKEDKIFISAFNGAKWYDPGKYLIKYSYEYEK